jgi:hexosaminidase
MMINQKTQRTLLLVAFFYCTAQHLSAQDVSIIPAPVSVATTGGQFQLTGKTSVYIGDTKLDGPAGYLVQRLNHVGLPVQMSVRRTQNVIELVLNKQANSHIGNEGYTLEINDGQVMITGNTPAGVFYGIQSLMQLLPVRLSSNNTTVPLPAVKIVDNPRFAWRGVMLDVSRHFFPKEYLKKYIEQLAAYKFNRLHLHLTDDNGWRIEIKSLPRLTSVGAWRVPRTGTFGSNEPPKPGEKATYGGYYSQEDIREIVAFAKERFIEILPEIDVPGHSMAAIAAYPELCVTKDTTIKVNPGTDFSTWYGAGKFEMHIDNTLNPADEKVYQFIDKVVTELATLFPFEYIHMGGDECYKGYWTKDPSVQAFMKKNKIKDGAGLQAYFTRRVNDIVIAKGKKMIGWDEILEGDIPSETAVMSWQGTKGGIEASKHKHTVVMSPNPEYYLDMMQGDPSIEAPVYNSARLKEVYHFNILPAEADSAYIIGGQGNLWTEQVPTTAQLEYMMFPRAFAIAETLWSPKSRKNWSNFVVRTETHFSRFDAASVNYSTSMYDPIITVSKNDAGRMVVDMTTEVEGLDLFYTLDNSIPNQYHSKYTGPIELSADVDNFRVISYRNGRPMGRLISLKREDLAKRIRKKK